MACYRVNLTFTLPYIKKFMVVIFVAVLKVLLYKLYLFCQCYTVGTDELFFM